MANRLTRLLHRLRGKSNAETPPHTTQGWESLGVYTGGQPADGVWKNYSEAQRQDIAAKHALVYACISAIADRVPEAPLEVGRDEADGWKVDAGHYLNGVLAAPNVIMTWADVERFCVANLLAAGEMYLWELRDDAGQIAEVWPLPAAWVTPVWTDSTDVPIARYEIPQQGKDPLRIPVVNMTYARFIDPRNYKQSLAPLTAASREVQTDMGRQDYVIEMLTNLNVPGLAVFTEKPLTTQQQADLKAKLADVVGPGRRGSTVHLSGQNARVEAIAPLKDLDWPGLNAIDESRICAAFKVPPVVVGARIGVEKSAQFANYSTALRHFYTGTMKPMWLFLGSALTRGLVVQEPLEDDKAVELRYDLTDVQGLQEDSDKRAERATSLFSTGVATLGQAVELAGLPAMDSEDPLYVARFMPLNMVRVDVADTDVPAADHMPDDEGAEPATAPDAGDGGQGGDQGDGQGGDQADDEGATE